VQSIKAIALTSNVKDWLGNTNQPRILHVFDHVCNVINKQGEILSIVSPEIRNGPFNVVIEEDVCLSKYLSIKSPIYIFQNQLMLAGLTIDTTDAKLWNSFPNWEKLHAKRYRIFDQIRTFSLPSCPASIPDSMAINLSKAIANADNSTARIAASQLAGLGQGLTPSGDDFIMGALLAAWIIHPANIAKVLAEHIAVTAASLTTSLSAAWLRSTGKGEAGSLWHHFFDALISENTITILDALEKLHNVGHTSGDDALAGFTSTLMSYVKWETKPCPS